MLNLVSRKQFWMKKRNIRDQIRSKAPELDADGRHYNIGTLINLDLMYACRGMTFERRKIEINYRVMKTRETDFYLGWFGYYSGL